MFFAEFLLNFLLTMSNQHKAEIQNTAHMANNQLGINFDDKPINYYNGG